MELDFSVLNQIPAIVASNDFTEPLDSPDITMPIEEEEPGHSHREEPESGAIHRLDREKEELRKQQKWKRQDKHYRIINTVGTDFTTKWHVSSVAHYISHS